MGGIICIIGQTFINVYMYFGLSFEESSTLSTITLILISALLTAFNVYDNLGKVGGAGALFPLLDLPTLW